MSKAKNLKATIKEGKLDGPRTTPGDVTASRKPPQSATTGKVAMSTQQPVVAYANEKARIASEIGAAIASISKDIPAEGQNLDAQTITFAPEYLTRGTYAVFMSGTVIGTDKSGVFVVPQRSLQILERLHIPYQVV